MVSVKANKSSGISSLDALSASGANSGAFVTRVAALAVAVLFFIGYMLSSSSEATERMLKLEPQTIEGAYPLPDLKKFEGCEVSFQRPEPSGNTKPILLASYPGSGNNPKTSEKTGGDVVVSLFQRLTGGAPVLNWHMTGPVRGHCQPSKKDFINDVAICTTNDPAVPINPEKQKDKFDSRMLLLVRNYLTAFPNHWTEKGLMYHNKDGQEPEEKWREYRDTWFNSTKWAETIVKWKGSSSYTISSYIPYERMIDPVQGPKIAEKLAVERSWAPSRTT
jgi:hypothetical protein